MHPREMIGNTKLLMINQKVLHFEPLIDVNWPENHSCNVFKNVDEDKKISG